MISVKQCNICDVEKGLGEFVIENGKRLQFCKQCDNDMHDFAEELGDEFIPIDELTFDD